jgi:hypothetical protein
MRPIGTDSLVHAHVTTLPDYKKVVLGMSPLCDTWMRVTLAHQKLHEFHLYSAHKSSSIQGTCLVNLNVVTPKTLVLEMDPEIQS